jgi:hypothetical protein
MSPAENRCSLNQDMDCVGEVMHDVAMLRFWTSCNPYLMYVCMYVCHSYPPASALVRALAASAQTPSRSVAEFRRARAGRASYALQFKTRHTLSISLKNEEHSMKLPQHGQTTR